MGETCGKQVKNREYQMVIDEEVDRKRRERSGGGGFIGGI